MKRKKLNSFCNWVVSSVTGLIVLGSGSMAAGQTVTSYNDLAWGTGQLETNITKITSPNGGSGLPSNGQLVDFATGNPTGVTLTVTGGMFVTANATQGANPTTGDAFDAFDGKVSGLGAISYIDQAGSNLVLTFDNMDQNKVYDITFFGHRDANGWDRASLVTLSTGPGGGRTNISSAATDNPSEPGGVIFSGPSDNSTRLPADNDNGYVARWNQVLSGSDGQVTLTISFDGSVGEQFKGKYASAVRLIESGGTSSTNPNDLDGDGKGDLVWRNTSTGDVAVWLMNGLTVGSTGFPGGVPTEWTIADVADVDGDGNADLVWRNTSTGDVAVWLMNGLTVGSTGFPGGVPTEWTIAGVRDMNGDGNADLVWRNTSTGDVAVWLMNGLTVGSTGFPGGVPTEWTIAGVGDMDGDGNADLVWRNTSTGDVAVWLMNGLTVGSTGFPGGVPTEWTIAGVGDMDGDGNADLVWRNTSTGDVAVWLMNGLTVGSTGFPGGVPTEWTIANVADVDGDGNADLVWRNTSTGDVAVWLMNGLTVGSTGFPGGVPTEWVIK